MGRRIICEVCDDDGRGVAYRWIEKELTSFDRGQIEARFTQIEALEGDHPKWLKPYKSLKMLEIRVDYAGKAVRFLCHEDERKIVILEGCIKKGQIDEGSEGRTVRRRKELIEGKLNVRKYPLSTR